MQATLFFATLLAAGAPPNAMEAPLARAQVHAAQEASPDTAQQKAPRYLEAGPIQLSGWDAVHAFRFSTPKHAGKDFVLSIEAKASDRLDPKRSFVVIEVDGRKVLAKTLVRLQHLQVRTPLKLKPGEHRAEIRARVVTVDDSCENGTRSLAWLDVDTVAVESAKWTGKRSNGTEQNLAVALEQWRTNRTGDVDVVARHIPAQRQSLERWQATLALDHLLRDWDLRPAYKTQEPSTSDAVRRRVELSLLPKELPDTGSYKDLTTDLMFRNAPHRRSAIRVVDETIVIVARDAAAVADLIHALGDTQFLQRCSQQRFCMVGDGVERLPKKNGPSSGDGLTLKTMGLPYGFTAAAAARQSVRFLFQRPQHWESTGEAWLELFISAGRLLPGDQVGLTLQAGGRPIVSWDVGPTKEKPHRLMAKIPKRFLEDAGILFELTLEFPPMPDGCTGEAPRQPWAHVESESRVIFPRVESHRRELGNYPDEAPKLNVEVSASALDDVASHAAALYPIHQNLSSTGWAMAGEGDVCSAPCVHVLPAKAAKGEDEASDPMVVEIENPGDSVDDSGAQHLPVLRDSRIIEMVRDGDEQGHLWVRARNGGAGTVQAPSKEALVTQRALLAGGKWSRGKLKGDVHSIVRVRGTVALDGAVTSRATAAQRGFDTYWLIGLLAVLAGSLVWLTSTRRRRESGAPVA